MTKKNFAKYIIIIGSFILWSYFFFSVVIPSSLEWLFRSRGSDFQVCYEAAEMISKSPGQTALYNRENMIDIAITDPENISFIDYVYPPFYGWFLIPLTKFSFSAALGIWRVLSIVFLGLAIWLLGKIMVPADLWRRHRSLVVVGLSAAMMLTGFSFPVIFALVEGQVILLIFFLLVLSLWAYGSRKKIGAGLALALAGAIKIFPLFLLIYFLIKKNLRWTGLTLLSFLMLTLLPLPLVGWQVYQDFWIRDVLLASAPPKTLYAQGLFSFLDKLFGPSADFQPLVDLAPWLPVFKMIIFGIVFLMLWRQLRRTENLAGGFSLSIIALLLVWPVSWVHTFVLLLIPMFFVAGAALKRKLCLPGVIWIGLAIVLFFFVNPWPAEICLLSPFFANVWTLITLGLWFIVSWFLKQEGKFETG